MSESHRFESKPKFLLNRGAVGVQIDVIEAGKFGEAVEVENSPM